MRKANQNYDYVSHPHNLPLEIDGKSKKRIQPLKKEEFNGDRGSINEEGRSLLLKKLSHNAHDLEHFKSVLPADHSRKQSRPNSIKTFNEDKENIKSGIDYLMQKTEHLKTISHKQKAHVVEFQPTSAKRAEKKHFASVNVETQHPELSKPPTHKKTAQIKLTNDLYSNVYREEREKQPAKRVESANLFRSGEDLGFQKKREKKMSENKLVEMFGSECMRGERAPLRERRQDWRTSNVNFF